MDKNKYFQFLDNLKDLIREGAITSKLQLFLMILNYVGANHDFDNILEDSKSVIGNNSRVDSNSHDVAWDTHFGGKVYDINDFRNND